MFCLSNYKQMSMRMLRYISRGNRRTFCLTESRLWRFFFITYYLSSFNAIAIFITISALLTTNVFVNNSFQGCLLPISLIGVNLKDQSRMFPCQNQLFFDWYIACLITITFSHFL